MSQLLTVTSATKSYSGVTALSDVSFELAAGSVLAIVGENGAGKSTLLNVIGGGVAPDHGLLMLAGAELRLGDPLGTLSQGIATVHQELTLFPELTVWENIWVGHELRGKTGQLDTRRMIAESTALLDEIEAAIDPHMRVGQLSIAEQTQVEIVKALSWRPRLLILDEATSALGREEVSALFRLVRRLLDEMHSVIFVSHRLGEVFEIADTILTLRDGRLVSHFHDAKEVTEDQLVTAMIGRSLESIFPEKSRLRDGTVLLEVEGLRGSRVKGVSFRARAGEIVGLGGLQGHGQQELLQMVFGAAPRLGGHVAAEGGPLGLPTPRRMKRAGIAYIPPDRKTEGLLLGHSVETNLTLAALDTLSRRSLGWLPRASERQAIEHIRSYMNIVQRAWRQTIESLSGGNQQKVLIGRWLELDPTVLLLDEPTRGVDIGTKSEIYRLLRGLADAGKTVIIASTENTELLSLCDRILVMYDGRINSELVGADIDEYHLTTATMGLAPQQSSSEDRTGSTYPTLRKPT